MNTKRIAAAAYVLSILFFAFWPPTGIRASDDQPTTILQEDFEGGGKMTFWDNNGLWKVHFAGPSEEQASSGKRSFKIDVTWLDTSWDCWRPSPLVLLYRGNPKVRAKLHVGRGDAWLGHRHATAEAGDSGCLVDGRKLDSLPDGWVQWVATAGGTPGKDKYLQAAVVWLRPDADGRTVVYVDDIEVEAGGAEDHQAELKARIDIINAERDAKLQKEADAFRARFQRLARQIAGPAPTLPVSASPELSACFQRLGLYCDQSQQELDAQLARFESAPTRSALIPLPGQLALLEKAQASRGSLVKYAEARPTAAYVVWIVEPLSNEKVLPKRFPVPGVVGTELRCGACPGEYEPVSFAVYALKELNGVIARATDARCDGLTIPASAIDVRIVKCWWQAGVPIADLTHPTLTPELLLKDPDFVTVDDQKKRNVVRDPKAPRDAEELQPVDIAASSAQQFWVTVHVPDDARPGTYRGAILLEVADTPPLELPLTIQVRPFRLEEPLLQYSLYYRGILTQDNLSSINGQARSESQYLTEMRNLKAHGITHPTCYQPFDGLLDRAIELRKQAGIAVDPLYALGIHTEAPRSPEAIEALKQRVRAGVDRVRAHGIKELYVYGRDEATGERLEAQREAFRAVHEAGAKVMVACYSGAFELVGDLLDLAVHSGPAIPSEARKWHAAGRRVFSYGNPQSGVELPEIYRRNYGLALWKAGYDGACDYAFRHAVGDVWDEYDHHKYRDIVFVYPTADGVIDTVAWEGFREGVDDVRYLTTLLKVIERPHADAAKRELAAEARKWVETMDPQGDLSTLREKMVRWILRLRVSEKTD